MTYTKPTAMVLGDAAELIQGSKQPPNPDAGSLTDEQTEDELLS
jgi:hypothetical protein